MGAGGYFSYSYRTASLIENGALVINQENGAVFRIDEAGAVLLSIPIEQAQGSMRPLIESHVYAALETGLSFAQVILEKFDPTQKLTRVVLVSTVGTSNTFRWRTSAEHAASPDSMQISMHSQSTEAIHINPADRTAAALKSERPKIAADMLILLRRQYRT